MLNHVCRTNPAERIEHLQNQFQQLANLAADYNRLNANRIDLINQIDVLQNNYVPLDVRPPVTRQTLPPP